MVCPSEAFVKMDAEVLVIVNLWYCHTTHRNRWGRNTNMLTPDGQVLAFFSIVQHSPNFCPMGRSVQIQSQTSTGVGQVFTKCKHGGVIRKD